MEKKRNTPAILMGILLLVAIAIIAVMSTSGGKESTEDTLNVEDAVAATMAALTPTGEALSAENQIAATVAALQQETTTSPMATGTPAPVINAATATAAPNNSSGSINTATATAVPNNSSGSINAVDFVDQPITIDLIRYLVSQAQSTSAMLESINVYMMVDDTTAIGGEWGADDADDGLTLVGPKVIWTDFLGEGYPACVEPLKVQGEWGVFYIPSGCEVTIPTINGGGRWISIVDHELVDEMRSLTHRGVHTSDVAMEIIIEYWDDDYSISFEGGGTLTLNRGQIAVVWTNFDGAPPELAFSWNADYGYGVFLFAGPGEWSIPSGGAHVLETTP